MAQIISQKNSVQLGQNFQNQLPDNLSGIKNDLQPTWVEVKKITSDQPGQKYKTSCYHKSSQKSRSFLKNFQIVISFFEKMWYNVFAKQI